MKSKLYTVLPVMVALMFFSMPALAEEAASGGDNLWRGYLAIGAGIGMGIAALGGGIGQGIAAGNALSGIARNPNASGKIFTPMIIGLALIESLVIYALVISYLLVSML